MQKRFKWQEIKFDHNRNEKNYSCMGEKELIKKLNDKRYFKIKKIGVNEVEITTTERVFTLQYPTLTYLNIIDKCIDKQEFPIFNKIKKIPNNSYVLCNLKFEIIHVGDWMSINRVSERYIKDYQALIRLENIGINKFVITNIDRNRKLWN